METTVLVVDDDPGTRAFIADALQVEGYQVVQAVDGEAVQVAQDHQPDLILLDMMMPQMDGYEVSRRLRADPATARIPIIGMSAGERLASVPANLIDDRLPKPFGLNALYSTVARWASPHS